MATATEGPSKTGFVRDFLQGNPQANAKAVNEAWSAGGMDGTINHATVSEVRKQMGLIGKEPTKTRKADKQKPASKESKAAPATPKPTGKRRRKAKTVVQGEAAKAPEPASATLGKTGFVKEFLNDHPEGNVKAVNEAWNSAGFAGTISPALVHKMRASLGLTGHRRGATKKSRTTTKGKATPTGKKLGRPRKETTVEVTGKPAGQSRGSKNARTVALTDLEADIDRLIFQVMGIGDLTEIEDSLRRARRLLYGALTRG